MSVMRRRRLERLEKLLSNRGTPYRDISDWAIPHLLAVIEGRVYSILLSPDRELTDETEQV